MNLGMPEMLFIFVLALLIFGPKKLPEIGRQIGQALGEFRRASNEVRWKLESEVRKIEQEAAVNSPPAVPAPEEPVKDLMDENFNELPAENATAPAAGEVSPAAAAAPENAAAVPRDAAPSPTAALAAPRVESAEAAPPPQPTD
jgi:TatA/E family protein of Tat protein translocase